MIGFQMHQTAWCKVRIWVTQVVDLKSEAKLQAERLIRVTGDPDLTVR